MSNRYKKILLLIGDIVCFVIATLLAIFIEQKGFPPLSYVSSHVQVFLILSPLWTIIFFIEGLYSLRTFNQNGLILSLLRASFFSGVATVIFLYLFGSYFGITPKTNLIITIIITLVLTFVWRKIFFKIFSYRVFTRDVSFIGKSEIFNELKELFRSKRHLGFKVVSHTSTFAEFKESKNLKLIILDDGLLRSEEVGKALFEILNNGINILNLSEFSEVVSGKIPLDSIDHTWFIDSKINLNQGAYLYVKAIFDKLLALIVLFLSLPIAVILFPVLFIFSGRPFFYTQTRVGANNKKYTIYKLRSMNLDAEKNGAQWSQEKDGRITLIGKFLRDTRIDELPQLWNVLNGSMTFVGPRPERPEIIRDKLENVIPFYNYRHLVKPGITGWAQVHYGYGASQNDSLIKLQYDLFYIKNRSFGLDLRIILKTIKTVLARVGR